MMRAHKVLAVGVSVVLAATFAGAEDVVPAKADKALVDGKSKRTKFQVLDSSRDGKLSLDEFKKQTVTDPEKAFAEADSDKDGGLNEAEFMAARKAAQEKVRAAKRAERAAAKGATAPTPSVPAKD